MLILYIPSMVVASDSALIGTFTVFDNHLTKQGRQINLNIVVVSSLDKESFNRRCFFGCGPLVTEKNGASFCLILNILI
jgi:hypothetical protein